MNKLSILIFILSITSCNVSSQTINESLQKSRALIAENQNNEAIIILNSLINHKQIKNDVLMYRSQAYFQLGDYSNCIKDAKELLNDKNDLTKDQRYNANWNAGVSQITQGKFSLALDYISNAQKLKKDDIKANQALALVYINLNRFDDAMIYLKNAQIIAPDNFGNYKLLGQLFLMKGEFENALLNYDKTILLNPNYGPAYENRATVKLKLNDKEGACSDLKKAFDLGLTHLNSIINEICK